MLKRLAKRPERDADAKVVALLIEFGLATLDERPGFVKITPNGRRYIALNYAGFGRSSARSEPLSVHRERVATIAHMQKAGWAVIAHCQRCGTTRAIDLDLLAWQRGARTVLWTDMPACLTVNCNGPAAYKVKLPDVPYFQQLVG